jgi:WD40 repeat protein
LGTITGSIIVYDIENNRSVLEKSITPGKRIEVISTSTIRYFDTYLSRIATTSRGDPNVLIFSFNHSFSVIQQDCAINLFNVVNVNQPDIPLSCLVNSLKFSPDTFYLALGDYSGSIRLYRFVDIPQNIKQIDDQKLDTKKDFFNNQFAFGAKKDEKSSVPSNNIKSDAKKEDPSSNIPYILVNTYKYKDIENFSIIKKEEVAIDPKDKKTAEKKQPVVSMNQLTNKNDKTKGQIQPVIPTEPVYDIKSVNEGNNDITSINKLPVNYPYFCFNQKRLIIDENSNNNFISYLVTNGFYYSFYGSKNFKYVCLFTLINDKMKNSFKIYKNKNVNYHSAEDNISMSTSVARKEKEFVSFLKAKVETLNNFISNNPSQILTTNQVNITEKIKYLEEFTFDLIYPLSCLFSQKSFQTSNYLGVGMKDGSILVIDTDAQCDKQLFQSLKSSITQISIDENYLVGCSLDGQVHIYDIVSGQTTYKCYHNPYQNFPIQAVKFDKFVDFAILHLAITGY